MVNQSTSIDILPYTDASKVTIPEDLGLEYVIPGVSLSAVPCAVGFMSPAGGMCRPYHVTQAPVNPKTIEDVEVSYTAEGEQKQSIIPGELIVAWAAVAEAHGLAKQSGHHMPALVADSLKDLELLSLRLSHYIARQTHEIFYVQGMGPSQALGYHNLLRLTDTLIHKRSALGTSSMPFMDCVDVVTDFVGHNIEDIIAMPILMQDQYPTYQQACAKMGETQYAELPLPVDLDMDWLDDGSLDFISDDAENYELPMPTFEAPTVKGPFLTRGTPIGLPMGSVQVIAEETSVVSGVRAESGGAAPIQINASHDSVIAGIHINHTTINDARNDKTFFLNGVNVPFLLANTAMMAGQITGTNRFEKESYSLASEPCIVRPGSTKSEIVSYHEGVQGLRHVWYLDDNGKEKRLNGDYIDVFKIPVSYNVDWDGVVHGQSTSAILKERLECSDPLPPCVRRLIDQDNTFLL